MTEQTTPATDRRKPRAEYRELALTRATEIATAHNTLSYPGDFALVTAVKFADFLENGAPEEPAK